MEISWEDGAVCGWNKWTTILSWVRSASQSFNIAFPWFLSRCRVFFASLWWGSSRKVSFYVFYLFFKTSPEQLRSQGRDCFLCLRKCNLGTFHLKYNTFTLHQPACLYLLWDLYTFPGLCLFWDCATSISSHGQRDKLWFKRALPSWVFICHYSLRELIFKIPLK